MLIPYPFVHSTNRSLLSFYFELLKNPYECTKSLPLTLTNRKTFENGLIIMQQSSDAKNKIK